MDSLGRTGKKILWVEQGANQFRHDFSSFSGNHESYISKRKWIPALPADFRKFVSYSNVIKKNEISSPRFSSSYETNLIPQVRRGGIVLECNHSELNIPGEDDQ